MLNLPMTSWFLESAAGALGCACFLFQCSRHCDQICISKMGILLMKALRLKINSHCGMCTSNGTSFGSSWLLYIWPQEMHVALWFDYSRGAGSRAQTIQTTSSCLRQRQEGALWSLAIHLLMDSGDFLFLVVLSCLGILSRWLCLFMLPLWLLCASSHLQLVDPRTWESCQTPQFDSKTQEAVKLRHGC